MGDNATTQVVVAVGVEKCDGESKAISELEIIFNHYILNYRLLRKEVFLLRPNGYKLFVLLTLNVYKKSEQFFLHMNVI